MSISQRIEQYKNKFGTGVMNTLLISKYWSAERVKELRREFTYRELSTGKLIKVIKC